MIFVQLSSLDLKNPYNTPMFFSELALENNEDVRLSFWEIQILSKILNTFPKTNSSEQFAPANFGTSRGKPPIFRSPSLVRFRSRRVTSTNRWTPAGPSTGHLPVVKSCQVGMEFRRCEDQALVMKDGDLVTLDSYLSYPPKTKIVTVGRLKVSNVGNSRS